MCVCGGELKYFIQLFIHPHYWKFFCRGTEINSEAHDSFPSVAICFKRIAPMSAVPNSSWASAVEAEKGVEHIYIEVEEFGA